jgi:hypothetical protein
MNIWLPTIVEHVGCDVLISAMDSPQAWRQSRQTH